jgi:C-terminal processing protease CtpA/Prc
MKKIILMLVILYLSMSLFAGAIDNDQQKLIDEYYFYNNWKKYDKAISAMEQYLQENSSSFYEYQLGKTYLFSGKKLKKAGQIYINFIKNYEHLEDKQGLPLYSGYWRLGMVYEAMGNLEEAKSNYQKGLDIEENDNCRKALENLGDNTKYNEQLTKNEKLCYFFKIWHYSNDFFAFFDQIDLDWEKVKMEYLPRVQAAKSNEKFYWLMTEMIALLKDGHTNAFVQGLWKPAFIQTKIIGNNAYFINDESYRKQTMLPGNKILRINNIPVIDVIEETKKYISSSTEQWIKSRLEFDRSFINFNHCDSIVVEYKQNGKIHQKIIHPSPKKTNKNLPYIESKLLINNIGYIAVNSMHPTQEIISLFDSALDSLFETKALIIDIRNNGGGSSNTGFYMIVKISNKPLQVFKSKVRIYSVDMFDKWFSDEEIFDVFYSVYQGIFPDTTEVNKEGLQGKFKNCEYFVLQPRPPIYDKPVVVLIGPKTFSAAEDFLAPLHGTERVTLIGKSTGGSTGQPLMIDLNNDLSVRICSRRCWCADGYEFVGKGFVPDIEVEETIEDIFSKKDVTLERAILYLEGEK